MENNEKIYKIIEKTKIFFAISIVIIVIGLGSLAVRGLNLGIDFKGGTVIELGLNKQLTNTDIDKVRDIADKYDPKADSRIVGTDSVSITSSSLVGAEADQKIQQLVSDVKAQYPNLIQKSTDRIGATVSQELQRSAFIASLIAVLLILGYVTIRFEFQSAISAIIALVHDLLIMITVYAVFRVPVNSSFIAAMLTVLGYSICDTIVVFDRIRENRKTGTYKDYALLANYSMTHTMARSINTVLAVLCTITCVYIFGVTSIKDFAFPLIIGIASGCYSSLFIATPIWVILEKRKKQVA